MSEGSVDGSAADLHGGDRVQDPDSTLEWLKVRVFIGEHAESPLVDTKADTGVNVFFRRLEPSIAGGLRDRNCEHKQLGE